MSADFSSVTELPGNQASAEQLSMIHTRYKLAYDLCEGKDVLEAACGPGRGLGYLAQRAKSVIGGDFTPALVEQANRHYGGRLKIIQMDAQAMPFADSSFDIVLLFEALYYLQQPEKFFLEARRVLRTGGTLLICTPNREWPEFNPSPFSSRYLSADELRIALVNAGFQGVIKAGFRVDTSTILRKIVRSLRMAAVALNLMPKTMAGKALLKRFFYGELRKLGPEIDSSAVTEALVDVGIGPVRDYKVLYALAQRNS